jgi:hypothetical protein
LTPPVTFTEYDPVHPLALEKDAPAAEMILEKQPVDGAVPVTSGYDTAEATLPDGGSFLNDPFRRRRRSPAADAFEFGANYFSKFYDILDPGKQMAF